MAWCIVLIVFLFYSDVFAAGINRLGGLGPRDLAMGGTGTATADDVAIFYRNPSLLTWSGNFIQIGGEYIRSDYDYIDPKGNESDSYIGRYFIVPMIGASYKPTDRLALGLGITVPNFLEVNFLDTLGYYSKSSLKEIAPSIAYRIWDNLSLGAALKIGYGQLELRQPIFKTGQFNIKGDGWGYSWQIGATWKASKWLSLGASYQSQTKVSLDGKIEQSTSISKSSDDFGADFYFPGRYELGIGVEFGNYLFTANFVWFDYSSNSLVSFRRKSGTPHTLALDWKDNRHYGLGAEYKLFKKWRLRAGITYEDRVVPDNTISPAFPDMNGFTLNGGIGFRPTENWGIDIGYLHFWGPERNTDSPNPGAGKYSAEQGFGIELVSAAVSYRF